MKRKGFYLADGVMEPKHLKRLNFSATSRVFLWCIQKQHRDGTIHGGRVVTAAEIGDDLGLARETVTRQLLDMDYYFDVGRTSHGYRIRVRKNKKFPRGDVTSTSQHDVTGSSQHDVTTPSQADVTNRSQLCDEPITSNIIVQNKRILAHTPKPKAVKDPNRRALTDQLVALWRERYEGKTGPHWPNGAYTQLDKLLKTGELHDEVIRRFKTYLADEEPWLVGHPLMLFATRYDRWAIAPEDDVPAEWRHDAGS